MATKRELAAELEELQRQVSLAVSCLQECAWNDMKTSLVYAARGWQSASERYMEAAHATLSGLYFLGRTPGRVLYDYGEFRCAVALVEGLTGYLDLRAAKWEAQRVAVLPPVEVC